MNPYNQGHSVAVNMCVVVRMCFFQDFLMFLCNNCVKFSLILGSSFLLLNPCNQSDSVAVKVCAHLGTNLTIACNIQDSAAAWLGPNFENPELISPSMVTASWLNGMVELKFISNAPPCILSSATIDNVQQSADGLDLFCRTNLPDRSGANISIIVISE